MSPLPLAGVQVADFTRVLTGPYCTMQLADLGADVIKVEPPQGDDTRAWGPPYQYADQPNASSPNASNLREASYFLGVNRGKRSLVLDLKTAAGQQAAEALIARSDLVVENFRPCTFARLGFDWERLHAQYPRLIYASITGFGAGPYRDRPGYDVIAQGMGGLMSYNGEPGGQPLRVGVAVADVFAGALMTQALLAALYQREQTGKGQRLEVNLLESVIALGANQISSYLAAGEVPTAPGLRHRSIVPYGTFPCQDGFINVAVGNDSLWYKFCLALGAPELASNPAYARNEQRVERRAEVEAHTLALLTSVDRAELLRRLDAAGVPSGPVYNVAEVFADPHVQARGVALSLPHALLGHTTVTAPPWEFDGERPPVRLPPPALGQHTAEILSELGLSAQLSKGLGAEALG